MLQKNPSIKLERRALYLLCRTSRTYPRHPHSSANTPIIKKMRENKTLDRKTVSTDIPLPSNRMETPPAIKSGVNDNIMIAPYHF